METTLFRAKYLNENEWIFGHLVLSYYMSDPEESDEKFYKTCIQKESGSYVVDEKTVCQFTGAIDCSGKQIFENDILFNEDRMQHQVVFYDEERFSYFCKYVGCEEIVSLCNSIGNINYKVGNIFDNADLVSF